jgi:hypothetical protein
MNKEAKMTYTYDDALISDLHKDAFGYRPRAVYFADWRDMTPGQKQAEWDDLCAIVEENNRREADIQSHRYDEWNAHVSKIAADNRVNLAAAIYWDMDAMGVSGAADQYCFKWGMSFSVADEIRKILKG